VRIREALATDRNQLLAMRAELWPEGSLEEHASELDATLGTGMSGTLPGTTLVSQDEDGALTGFLEVGLRSHADGCDTAQPVGFVEGWFVREAFRGRAVGKALMRAAEEWARGQGCREIASDTQVENEESQRAHAALGFQETDRCVYYRKDL
jgi:aminoglycoside 6'-N-acetyltransferase I